MVNVTYSLSGPGTYKAEFSVGALVVVAQLSPATGEPYDVRYYDVRVGRIHYVSDETRRQAEAGLAAIDRGVGRRP